VKTPGTKSGDSYVSFDVAVTNGTRKAFDPSLFQVSAQSGSTEGDLIIDVQTDSGVNVGAPPQTTVLPGRKVTYQVAFGVSNSKDLVVEVTPTFDYAPTIFTS